MLSTGPSSRLVGLQSGARASISHVAHAPIAVASAAAAKPKFGYLVYRITNPNRFNDKLVPPFTQLQVQTRQPVAGQVYNVLYLAVRNGTANTFDASSGFSVRFPGAKVVVPDPHGE